LTSWLKIGYFTASQEAAPDYWLKRTWVSDGPGRSSSRWRTHDKPRRGQTYPPFGPQYEVGDLLVIYITKRGVCPAILEVVSEPRWDPAWVDTESERGEGKRWGVVTEVQGKWAMSLDTAPSLEDIGVPAVAIQRKGHISLEDWQYEQAERWIAKDRNLAASQGEKTASLNVPIEEGSVEGYEVTPPATVSRAIPREVVLVRDYGAFFEAKGEDVTRNKVLPPGASHALYSDLFNVTKGHLIEAKAGTTRGDIRMAIGQIADYGRFVSPVERRAVLLEAKPHPDLLDLLKSQGIAAIWRASKGFADNADGTFT
jgi:hypothetical protein